MALEYFNLNGKINLVNIIQLTKWCGAKYMYLSLDQNLSKEIMKVLSLKLKILFFSFLSLYNYMPILVCSGLVPTAHYLTKSQPCIILDLLCMIHFSTIKEDFTQS